MTGPPRTGPVQCDPDDLIAVDLADERCCWRCETATPSQKDGHPYVGVRFLDPDGRERVACCRHADRIREALRA